MSKTKVTIKDVSAAAGVSKGTVDRVLHSRGEVSEESRKRVLQAIKDLGYTPDLNASLLASHKLNRIAFIVPLAEEGEYWDLVSKGALSGMADSKYLSCEVLMFRFDQYDSSSFESACSAVLDAGVDGVVMTPLYRDESLKFTAELRDRGVPYIFVDTKCEDEEYLAFYGMPMYESGRLCAKLLCFRNTLDNLGTVAIVRLKRDSDPTAARRRGFIDYMHENLPSADIVTTFINPGDRADSDAHLRAFLAAHPDVRNIVMFNSRVHLLSEVLKDYENCFVVGFDDLPRNLSALKEGTVDVLICQRTVRQGHRAVSAMASHLALGSNPPKDNYCHMDILIQDNLENY